MVLSSHVITAFRKEILTWYAQNKRDLPWRKSREPYRILISEVMLQQTQVRRVIPKYIGWLQMFPTLQVLAQAQTAAVLRAWSGLGYNRRALYLQKAAQVITMTYGGIFPQEIPILRILPGIGEYTARALACFAFDQQVAVVDTNIRKIITLRFYNGIPPAPKQLQEIAGQLLPQGRAYEWNQALMDYAAAVLVKEKVPTPKQSKFKDSNRYFRGQILQFLLKNHMVSLTELQKQLKIDDKTRFEAIVTGLEKEGFLTRQNDNISLKNTL